MIIATENIMVSQYTVLNNQKFFVVDKACLLKFNSSKTTKYISSLIIY